MDVYASGVARFTSFLVGQCKIPVDQVLPPGKEGCISQEHVELFLGYAATRFKLSTIKVTLASLVDWHKSKGAPFSSVALSNPSIKAILQSIAVMQGPSGQPVPKQGMSTDALRAVLKAIDESASLHPHMSHLFTRDKAWVLLGFFGLLRRSEIISLKVGNIKFNTTPTPHITLFLSKSKADQSGRGATIALPAQTGKSGFDIMGPMSAHMVNISKAGARAHDPLFPRWDPVPNRLLTSTPLESGEALAKRLRIYLEKALAMFPGLSINPQAYGMHSLRRGGVMAAWAAGAQPDRIKVHGRWASDAVRAYMHPTLDVLLSVTQGI
jgi:integrase